MEVITNETFEFAGTMPIQGTVRSTGNGVRTIYRFPIDYSGIFEGGPAISRGTIHSTFLLNERILDGTARGVACVIADGRKRCVRVLENDDIDLLDGMDGTWTLGLNVSESDRRLSGNAVVRLSNDRQLSFTLSGSRTRSGTATVTLRGTGEATGVTLRVKVDQAMNLKSVRGRVLGQTVRVLR